MKLSLPAALLALALSPLAALAQAPTSAAASAPATAPSGATRPPAPIDVLSPAEKTHLDNAHQQALAATPKLTEDETKLHTQLDSLRSTQSTPQEKQQFIASFSAYRKDLEVAMLKVDPTIRPIIDKLHAEEARLKAANP